MNKYILLSIIFFTVVLLGINSNSFVYNESNITSHVFVGDEYIGNTNQNQELKKIAIDQKSLYENQSENQIVTNDEYNVTVIPEMTDADFYYNDTEVTNYVAENGSYLTEGYTVYVDEEPTYYITDLAIWHNSVDTVVKKFLNNEKAYNEYTELGYFNPIPKNNKLLTSFQIENQIDFEYGYVSSTKIIDNESEMTNILMNENGKSKTYSVNANDTVESIAKKNKLSPTELYLNNYDLNKQTLLYEGADLNVTPLDPALDFTYTIEYKQNQTIPYGTEYRENSSLAKGTSRTIQNGRDGTLRVTYETTYKNGAVVGNNEIGVTPISEPVTQIIEQGTKVIPGIGTGQFIWPSPSRTVTCHYGCYYGHVGMDIQAWYGAPVYAADNGTVVQISSSGAYGNQVLINHNNGYQTRYAHLASINVRPGQNVQRGQVIGTEGASGNVTGEHLHFEIIYRGVPQNPIRYY